MTLSPRSFAASLAGSLTLLASAALARPQQIVVRLTSISWLASKENSAGALRVTVESSAVVREGALYAMDIPVPHDIPGAPPLRNPNTLQAPGVWTQIAAIVKPYEQEPPSSTDPLERQPPAPAQLGPAYVKDCYDVSLMVEFRPGVGDRHRTHPGGHLPVRPIHGAAWTPARRGKRAKVNFCLRKCL